MRRLGKETTAKLTDGVGLATPVSSPEPPTPTQVADNTTTDAANPNATSAGPTRPEGELHTPPDELPSPLLKGRRSGASDELRKLPVDESTATQPTWTPQVKRPSREVHGVAKNHKKAAEADVEGGEVNELAHMMNDGSRPSKDPGDMTGDSKHRPDEPTEPPNQPKGASA